MRSSLHACVVALGAAVLLAACGGSGVAHSSGAGKAAATAPTDTRQFFLASVKRTTSQSFRSDMTVDATFGVKGASASALGALGDAPMHMNMQMSVENARRVAVDITTAFGGVDVKATSIIFDGALYVSTDGGSTFKSVPVGILPSSQIGPSSAVQYLETVGTVSDVGPATADGVAVERYHADIDPVKVTALLRSSLSALQSPMFQKLLASMHFTAGTIDATVDRSGKLVTQSGTVDVTMDFSSLGLSSQASTMTLHEVFSGHFHDYGKPITVSRPANVTGVQTLP